MKERYNYKKTIETDLTKDDIYYRLIQVLKDKLEIKSFYIFEEDLQKDERKIIYAPKGKAPCCSIKKR